MAVRELSSYLHHKGGIYQLLTIALPIECMPEDVWYGRSSALHTELNEVIEIFNVRSVVFTEKDEFMAIYQKEGSLELYARPVDMFFEHIDGQTKRFTPLEEEDANSN